MKKTHFVLLPLAVLVTIAVRAETLDLIAIVSENTGAKSRTNVVTLEDMKKSTETDLRGVLSSEPAINFGGGNGGTSQWVTIRGMGQDQIDFKVDNTYSDAQIFHHQGRFMPDPALIKRIDVQKGAGSASAGIGATSGAIIATTVDAKDLLKENQDVGFKIKSAVSSNKGHSQGATVYARSGMFDALVSGNWVTQENYKGGKGYKNLEGSSTVKKSALNQRGLLAKIGVDLTDEQRIVLSHRQEHYHGVRALREEFDFSQDYLTAATGAFTGNGAYTAAKGFQQGAATGTTDRNGRATYYVLNSNGDYLPNSGNNNPRYRITNQDTTNLEWIGKNMGFITEAKANAYYKKVSRKELEPTTGAESETRIFTQGANVNFDSAIGDSHLIKYGLNLRHQKAVPNKLDKASHYQEKLDSGLYLEGIWGLGAFTLTTGARYDHFKFTAMDSKKVSHGRLNPSVGLIWQATNDLSFNTNLNYATRSPRLYEAALAGGGRRLVTVDSNLKAEHARNIEVGFNYELTDSLSLNGSYFWQHVKDAHSLRADGAKSVLYNGAELRNQGYELGAAYRYAALTLKAGVSHSKPEIYGSTADSTLFAQVVGRTWTTSVSYKFDNPGVELGWRGRFVEGETANPSRGSSASGAKVKRAGYGVNDFYVNWDVNDNIVINFAVNNAFNKNYKSHSQRAGANSLPAAGRDFRANVSYTF